MITETGRVTQVTEGKAVVEIERGSACSKCHAGCVNSGEETRTMVLEARDPIGVRIDQCVQVAIQNESALRAAFVVYMVPLCALVLGVLLGNYLGSVVGIENVLEALMGFGCLGLSLIVVRLYNNVFKQNIKNQPVITKIIG
jgi:sigma-E factor negative regulatory protein RseC